MASARLFLLADVFLQIVEFEPVLVLRRVFAVEAHQFVFALADRCAGLAGVERSSPMTLAMPMDSFAKSFPSAIELASPAP